MPLGPLPPFRAGRGCGGELDEIYFPESFKGKGNRAKGLFAMPLNIPATTIRIDPEAKKEATAILDELGLPMSTAVNAFLGALVREGGMLWSRAQTWCKSVLRSVAASPDVTPS